MTRATSIPDSLTRRRMILATSGVTVLGGLASLAACGRTEAPVDEAGRVRLRLAAGGPVNALHGGFYQALAIGAYERRGLNIEILTGQAGQDVPALLASSNAELAFGRDSFSALSLVAERAPVKAVAAFLQKDPVILIARPDPSLTDLSSLRERPILVSPQDREGFWYWLQARFELTDDQVKVAPLDDHLETMKTDPSAIMIGRLTQGEARRVADIAGFEPSVILPASDGYPSYSGLVLAPNAFARDNGPALRDFIAASVEGWRDYVHGDGSKGDALIRKANPDLSQALLDQARASLRSEAMVDGGDAALYGLGTMTAERWLSFADQTATAFATPPDWREAFTLQYLPGRS
ncbi:ABC transporter substrate-binding protein [Brevundimonas vesicularis]|uniref:ABC transporter substrate-binding protein n=1 Tax=Brevundimonas vesicularis TaxID=41276 RepID=UPI0038D408CA